MNSEEKLDREILRLARGKKREPRIELSGDAWTDRQLQQLADKTGFRTVAKMLRHVANEIAGIRTPAKFYRALSRFNEEKSRK